MLWRTLYSLPKEEERKRHTYLYKQERKENGEELSTSLVVALNRPRHIFLHPLQGVNLR